MTAIISSKNANFNLNSNLKLEPKQKRNQL